MAHYKRNRPRSIGADVNRLKLITKRLERKGMVPRFIGSIPGAFNLIEHIKPKRRETKRLEHAVIRGMDPDGVVWPVAKKPHSYWY